MFLCSDLIPLAAQMLILLCVFLLMVGYHARLVEVTSRLDFLWKQQAERELADMQETRHNNTQLLKNILPDHVARHFLSNEWNSEVNMLFHNLTYAKRVCFDVPIILLFLFTSLEKIKGNTFNLDYVTVRKPKLKHLPSGAVLTRQR